MKKFQMLALALTLALNAGAQSNQITLIPHAYYVYMLPRTGDSIVTMSTMLDEDNGKRRFIRMAKEGDSEFLVQISKIKACAERTLRLLNDPASAVIDMYALPDDGQPSTAGGFVKARNRMGGMIRKNVICGFQETSVSIY